MFVVEVEEQAGEEDGGVPEEEANGRVGMGLGEGVGGWEGGEVRGEGVVRSGF